MLRNQFLKVDSKYYEYVGDPNLMELSLKQMIHLTKKKMIVCYWRRLIRVLIKVRDFESYFLTHSTFKEF